VTALRLATMLATSRLIPFLLTVYVVILIPGPSVMFTVSRGVALGRRAALTTVLGNTAGLSAQLVVVVIGLGQLLAASQTVFTVMKLAGAAYLVYLGVNSIRHRKMTAVEMSAQSAKPMPTRRIIREGFVVGASNPKGLVIFTAILPNFVNRGAGDITLQLATLGAICVVVALLSDSCWALASGTAREWLGRSRKRLEWMSAGGGTIMVALGVGLALTGRKR
jgi:threonine/homoserine/homoserine lactone efflux protein